MAVHVLCKITADAFGESYLRSRNEIILAGIVFKVDSAEKQEQFEYLDLEIAFADIFGNAAVKFGKDMIDSQVGAGYISLPPA